MPGQLVEKASIGKQSISVGERGCKLRQGGCPNIPILRRAGIAAPSELGGPRNIARLKPGRAGGLKVIFMGGNHHHCRGIKSESRCTGMVDGRLRLVIARHIRAEDRVPPQIPVARKVGHKRDRAVGTGRQKTKRAERRKAGDGVWPGVEAFPVAGPIDAGIRGNRLRQSEPVQHNVEILTVEQIKRHIGPAFTADPLHGGLIFPAPGICEFCRVSAQAQGRKPTGGQCSYRGAPIDERSENIKDKSLRLHERSLPALAGPSIPDAMKNGMIDRLSSDGAGLLQSEAFDGAVPGDVVRDGQVEPGPNRATPPCAHAQACGGCRFQHVDDEYFSRWKQSQVADLLHEAGLPQPMRALHVSPERSRRRATFSAGRTKKTVRLGYMARGSDTIVDVADCLLVTPGLASVMPALRALTRRIASRKGVVKFAVTETASGPDLAISGGRMPEAEVISELAEGPWARVSWEGETILQARAPVVRLGGVPVTLPPAPFLQATVDGEAALTQAVCDGLKGGSRVADLFCGCGTFALPLARQADVSAFDSDAEMVAALAAAWRKAEGLKGMQAERRDLFRRPVLAEELSRFDGIALDPPRAGAAAQVAELARSEVPVIVYVSCNPVTFVRDAAVLAGAGYKLDWLDVVDQFRWSAHVETVARFSKGKG